MHLMMIHPPYFKKPCRQVPRSVDNHVSDQTQSSSMSPGKRIQLRSECLDQLTKLHSLLENGGVPAEQYHTLQEAILGDIQNFKQ